MRISDWSSDVCSSDLHARPAQGWGEPGFHVPTHLPRLGGGRVHNRVPTDLARHRTDASGCAAARGYRKPQTGGSLRRKRAADGYADLWFRRRPTIGRAHVRTPVTTTHLVCSLLLDKQQQTHSNKTHYSQ